MQIVIEIPEEEYNKIEPFLNGETIKGGFNLFRALKIIKNGIVLPKGHGRILDEKDILDTENNNGGWYDLVDVPEYIAGGKAIVEADKAESDPQERDDKK